MVESFKRLGSTNSKYRGSWRLRGDLGSRHIVACLETGSDLKLRSRLFAIRRRLVYSAIQTLHKAGSANLKDFADPQKRRYGNGTTGLDLLPMPSGKAKGDHIFLAKPLSFPQFSNSFAQAGEEFFLIRHSLLVKSHEQKHHEQNSCARIPMSLPMKDYRHYPLDPEAQKALGNISPELGWLYVKNAFCDAIEDHYFESEQLFTAAGLNGDLMSLQAQLEDYNPVRGVNNLIYWSPALDLKHIPELPPLEVLRAVLELFEPTDR